MDTHDRGGLTRVLLSCCVFLVLCQLVTSQTGPSCAFSWITHPSMNVPGGTLQPNVTTVKDCQLKCLAQSGKCVGMDFDGSNSCWLTAAGTLQADPTNRVAHYELLAEVKSCTTVCQGSTSLSWTETRHYHINEGKSLGNITFKDCLARCRDDTTCVAFDWDTLASTEKCWIIANNNPLQDAPYVYNYKKTCSTDGINVVAPGYYYPRDMGTTKGVSFGFVPAGPTTRARGMTTASLADYISGQSLGIKPAYIVLIGMGGACILMTIIAVIVIFNYPLNRDRNTRSSVVKTPKTKKVKNKRQLQTHVAKVLEEDNVGMNTIGSSHNSTYSGRKLYNDTKYNESKRDSYNEPSVHNSYNEPKGRDSHNSYNEVTAHETYHRTEHDSDETLERNSAVGYGGSSHRESAAVYGSAHRDSEAYGGSNHRDSAVAYGSHGGSNADNQSHRYSGDDHDNLVETRRSDYEAVEEEVQNEMENEGYERNDEDYD